MTGLGPPLDLFALTDADAITTRAKDAMVGADDAAQALRDAVGCHSTDARALKDAGRDDWALCYGTIAHELGKIARALDGAP